MFALATTLAVWRAQLSPRFVYLLTPLDILIRCLSQLACRTDSPTLLNPKRPPSTGTSIVGFLITPGRLTVQAVVLSGARSAPEMELLLVERNACHSFHNRKGRPMFTASVYHSEAPE